MSKHLSRDLFFRLKPAWEKYDLRNAEKYLQNVASGALSDIKNKEQSGYYQFLPVIIAHLKPKQIIELGGAMGASALMMLSALPNASKLYSITLEESGLEFSYVKEKYENFVPIVGDDLDLSNWPKDLGLRNTDLWFFDTDHTYEQLHAEYELYNPFFKKGSVILIDDIKFNDGMWKAWTEWEGDKFDTTTWLHWSGFGIVQL